MVSRYQKRGHASKFILSIAESFPAGARHSLSGRANELNNNNRNSHLAARKGRHFSWPIGRLDNALAQSGRRAELEKSLTGGGKRRILAPRQTLKVAEAASGSIAENSPDERSAHIPPGEECHAVGQGEHQPVGS